MRESSPLSRAENLTAGGGKILDKTGPLPYYFPLSRRSSGVEQLIRNQQVVGSIPPAGSISFARLRADNSGPFAKPFSVQFAVFTAPCAAATHLMLTLVIYFAAEIVKDISHVTAWAPFSTTPARPYFRPKPPPVLLRVVYQAQERLFRQITGHKPPVGQYYPRGPFYAELSGELYVRVYLPGLALCGRYLLAGEGVL